jgi:hypothetical protein
LLVFEKALKGPASKPHVPLAVRRPERLERLVEEYVLMPDMPVCDDDMTLPSSPPPPPLPLRCRRDEWPPLARCKVRSNAPFSSLVSLLPSDLARRGKLRRIMRGDENDATRSEVERGEDGVRGRRGRRSAEVWDRSEEGRSEVDDAVLRDRLDGDDRGVPFLLERDDRDRCEGEGVLGGDFTTSS